MAKMSGGIKILIVVSVLVFTTFLLSPVQLGPTKEFRILYILKEVHILNDELPAERLLDHLKSEDPLVQVDAIMGMARRDPPDPRFIKALRQFIDAPRLFTVKDIAIYALGELRAIEALPQLHTRLGDLRYEQDEVKTAIDKINGVIQKPWWK